MMKNNINYSTYIVIPNDSVPAAILEKYPALDTGDHRVLGTLARYISQMGCSLALRGDGKFLLIHHKNGYVQFMTIAKLIHYAMNECSRQMGDASGYQLMCLEEDEEELQLLLNRYHNSSEAYKARAAFMAQHEEDAPEDTDDVELPEGTIRQAAELDIDTRDADEEIYCAVCLADAGLKY